MVLLRFKFNPWHEHHFKKAPMRPYLKYLAYLLKHKWYVGKECLRYSLYKRAITHDLSKFLPSEFIPYAKYFYGPYCEKVSDQFDIAWLKHQHRNSHHWQYWNLREDSGTFVVIEMPEDDVKEMVCDWIGAGMCRNPSDNPLEETRRWYLKNKDNMLFHPNTRLRVEQLLKLA